MVMPVRSPRWYSRSRGVQHHLYSGGVGQSLGGARGAGQVGGPDEPRPHPRDVRRRLVGLRGGPLVERDVGVALGPALGVPGGLAVAEQDEPPVVGGVSHRR